MADVRIFYASDLHGSDLCFRKVVGAARSLRASAVILGGDLTGKALVPVVWAPPQAYVYTGGAPVVVEDEAALVAIETDLADAGRYAVRLAAEELERFSSDEDYQQGQLRRAAADQVRRWIRDAERSLAPLGIECYMMPGNDDWPEVAEALAESAFVVNHDEQVVYIKDVVPLIGLGSSNVTPFNSPRELSEEEIASRLTLLLGALPDPRLAILNTHCPPYGTGLDFAPEIGREKEIISYGGQPRMVPVGSVAVREAILRFQPRVGLHGHCHDSRHRSRLGATTCLNPGSQYHEGMLAGATVVLTDSGPVRCQFVNG